ncbi:MAG TPA: alpha/beta fold hydrolase [Opitutaceae bacterium]|nr:alpha/beta fold hydrolase [Opitutaceae bacterium]
MFTTPRGARMSYVDEGPRCDEAVVMLHGNPTWSFFYRNALLALRSRHRCLVPDHIGMGLSDKPEAYPYTLATRIADIEALISSLGIKRIHLIVHDWGGAIGFGLAVKDPARIGRIVILNTAAFRSDCIPRRIALCRSRPFGTWIVRGLNGFAGPAVTMAMHARRLTAAERQGYLFPYNSWANRVAVDAFVKDIPLEPDHVSFSTLQTIEAGLGQFRSHPVNIVWGGKDFCFNQHFLEEWKTFLPQAAMTLLPNVGHYVLDDGRDEPAIHSLLNGL